MERAGAVGLLWNDRWVEEDVARKFQNLGLLSSLLRTPEMERTKDLIQSASQKKGMKHRNDYEREIKSLHNVASRADIKRRVWRGSAWIILANLS